MSYFFIYGYGCPAVADPISIPHAELTNAQITTVPGCIEWTKSRFHEGAVQPTLKSNGIAQQFNELRSLADGWFDGKGFAPDGEKLDIIEAHMLGEYPARLPAPAIVPTPEGNLLFEWNAPGDPSVDIRFSDLKAEFHAFRADSTDFEKEFDLSSDEEWVHFLAFLSDTIGTGAP